MDGLDLIFENKNGQLEFNFNALEAVTNAEFVSRVKGDLERGHTIFSVDSDEYYTKIIYVNRYNVVFRTFDKQTDKISHMAVSLGDILDISNHVEKRDFYED